MMADKRLHPERRGRVVLTCTVIVLAMVSVASADDVVPTNSLVGRPVPGQSLHLVSPLELGSFVQPAGWHLEKCGTRRSESPVAAKLGRDALVFFGTATGAGKGDFAIGQRVPGETLALGCWVYLSDNANVKSVGFQIHDNEQEVLTQLVPADWTGWKWIEIPVTTEALKQAYPQPQKNKRPDMPIQGVHLVWWTKQAGPSDLAFDAVVAKVVRPDTSRSGPLQVSVLGSPDVAVNRPYGGSLLLSNESNEAVAAQIVCSLQHDGRLFNKPTPDPLNGTDHALGARSWTVAEGHTIAENTLTDGLDYTHAATPYRNDSWETDQYVELDHVRNIAAMGWQSGDANWIWKVNVAGSIDGKTFSPVVDLQGVDIRKKWGTQRFPAFEPFSAKIIRLHYHCDGQKVNVLRMPSRLYIWDGVADEQLELAKAGRELQRIDLARTIPPGSFAVVNLEFAPKLPPGQYLLASKVTTAKHVVLDARPVFVEPAWLDGVDANSRFGLNAARSSLAQENRKLGIGWVRFENFKWPFVSPAPHEYAFDGTTLPWAVNLDQITEEYRAAGLHILPMMFLTPTWASGADDSVPNNVRLARPPKDYADFGEFAFQSVARYGSKRVDPSKLKTKDRRSGLSRIEVFELGNEPNLNPLRNEAKPPTWGAWTGTMSQWWEMWRRGAEAVKQADPDAVVSGPGFAGMTSEIVDQMRVFKYADGKCPLDLVDVISVHFYSGRTPPEIATRDANNAQGYEVSFVEHLKRLVEWRDRYRPNAPIWMTETGYDTGRPIGTNEHTQAARLPRVVALCLANGIDKVFVYRESGSTPSQHAAAGVLRNDFSRKPSWYTYATLIRQLTGATAGHRLPHPLDQVWLQTWQRDGKAMLMAYCVTGEAKLGIELGNATVTDAFGGVTRVESTRELPLSEFPVYLSNLANEGALTPLVRESELQEQKRQRLREAEARRTIYLYNFGDATEPVATNIGRLRYYTPVAANCLYTPETGFGFVGQAATKNDFRHWASSDLEKYSVKIDKGQVFRFDVKPGTYELRVNAQPWGPSGDLLLTGATGGPIRLTFNKGTGETVVQKITVAGRSLQMAGTYQHQLRWLVFEEVSGP